MISKELAEPVVPPVVGDIPQAEVVELKRDSPPSTWSFPAGVLVPTPRLPVGVTVTSLACSAAVGVPVVGLSFAASMVKAPCGFGVLIPTCALILMQKDVAVITTDRNVFSYF
ncbi:hypothetical protein [Chryseobacterium sp.]|uniref:hypothetical protein n=1 Tax=Chryseobacterium sp. TaxID=1871047 RepID=UPI002622BFEE|nr:hypothetical protein [Chryseobacterium sp.]